MRRMIGVFCLLAGLPASAQPQTLPKDQDLLQRLSDDYAWADPSPQFTWLSPWKETSVNDDTGEVQSERSLRMAFATAEDGTSWKMEVLVTGRAYQKTPGSWTLKSVQLLNSDLQGATRPANSELEKICLDYLRHNPPDSSIAGTILALEGDALEDDPTQFFVWDKKDGRRVFRYSFFFRLLTVNAEDDLVSTAETSTRLFRGDELFLFSLIKKKLEDPWRVDGVQAQGVAYRAEAFDEESATLQAFSVADFRNLTWSKQGWDRVWQSSAWKNTADKALKEKRAADPASPDRITDTLNRLESLLAQDRLSVADLEPFFSEKDSAKDVWSSWKKNLASKSGKVTYVEVGQPRFLPRAARNGLGEARVDLHRLWQARGSADADSVDEVISLSLEGGVWKVNSGYENYPF